MRKMVTRTASSSCGRVSRRSSVTDVTEPEAGRAALGSLPAAGRHRRLVAGVPLHSERAGNRATRPCYPVCAQITRQSTQVLPRNLVAFRQAWTELADVQTEVLRKNICLGY